MDLEQYILPTSLIDSDSVVVNEAVNDCTKGKNTDKDKAVAIFYYVRDKIKFGFMPKFDNAPASYTLEKGMGHCNPKTHVFVAMLRACGIPARVHFVVMKKEMFRIIMPNIMYKFAGKDASHGFTEVFLDNKWINVDSYIVDKELFTNAIEKIKAENMELACGVSIHGVTEWDGIQDSFSQFYYEDSIPGELDSGVYADPLEFFASENNLNKMDFLRRLAYLILMRGMVNKNIEKVRRGF